MVAREQYHVAGDFDIAEGTVRSNPKARANVTMARGKVIAANGGTTYALGADGSKGPFAIVNEGVLQNDGKPTVDAFDGDYQVLYYVDLTGALEPEAYVKCAANGTVAQWDEVADAESLRVGKYKKHGKWVNDGTSVLISGANGDVVGIKLVP